MSTEPPPSPDARLCALIRRELGAGDVRVVAAADAPAESQNTMQAKLGDGRVVVATFFDTPEERDVLVRRLDMLASTFSLGLSEPPHKERGPVAKALHEELRALATRAQACDASTCGMLNAGHSITTIRPKSIPSCCQKLTV